MAGNAVARSSSVPPGASPEPEGSDEVQIACLCRRGLVHRPVCGRAADGEGRLLLECSDEDAGKVTGVKYGAEAQHAAAPSNADRPR